MRLNYPMVSRISMIFNVSDLYPYKAEEAGTVDKQLEVQWRK
jgi:hypothetical protein